MQLRVLIKRCMEPTKEQCEDLMAQDKSVHTLSQAHAKLKKPTEQHLQYCKQLVSPITGEVTEYWENIPVVMEEYKL